ncbi:ABC transporter substrate-binding protein [Saliterribacillus persicus]|uniref:L-arabinose-binding protein n=1 Tax=Saliterribacillus persicus TaxID=930114 RepID=A0A368Y9D9_9BACI|nr:extracellular solute-binding protein [Saliterribacillus persicus]RCW76891.1 L-arabinose-binding protein [Saliterribacillus persicus]
MRKRIFQLGIFAFLLLFIVACSGDDTSNSDADTDTDEATEANGEQDAAETFGGDSEDATELTFWTFQELHLGIFEHSVDRWNEEFPDRQIKLNAEAYPYDNLHNNLLLALQSGTGAPDIADIELSRFPNFMQGEPQLLPMNDHVEPVIDDFIESRFDIYSKDGNYYGMPFHVGATVAYYNTEIMDAAGVDIDSIETWDDYEEAGKKVAESTDAVMLTFETGADWTFWPIIRQQGSDYFDENGEVTINNETNVNTLQLMHDWIYEDEIADLTPGGEVHSEEFYGFMNDGGQASILMPMWYMGRFTDYMPDLEGKMVIRPMPRWTEDGNRSAGAGGTGTVVTNQTEHEELAKEFLAYTKLSEEGNIAFWEVLGFDPPMWTVWESEAMREDNKFYQYFGDDIFDTLLEVRDEIDSINITENNPDMQQELNTNVFNSVLRQQSQTAKEALDQAAETVGN